MGVRWRCAVAVPLIAVAVAGCGGGSKKAEAPKPLTDEQLIALVKPSVVQVYGKCFGDVCGGSGVIIDIQHQWAITNAHVTSGLAAMKARTGEFEAAASLVATAPCDDVSLIHLTSLPPGAQAIKLGTAANVVSGKRVEALGYPSSFQDYTREKLNSTAGTVSVDGTISASPEDDLPKYPSVIQHQAPIGHGSSGGPLVDRTGALLGINTLGNNPSTAQNQAYAISIDHIKDLLPSLEKGKSIAYVGWDLVPAKDLSEADLRALSWDLLPGGTGMAVVGVDTGSPADLRKFGFGDYIERIEGVEVKTAQDVCDVLESSRGQKIKVDGRYMGGPNHNTTWTEKLRVR